MTSDQRLALARSGLPYIAHHNGRQDCAGLMPDFNLWTLRATLSPALVAGGTYAEETLLGWLCAALGPRKGACRHVLAFDRLTPTASVASTGTGLA